jgi:hypothetical protein
MTSKGLWAPLFHTFLGWQTLPTMLRIAPLVQLASAEQRSPLRMSFQGKSTSGRGKLRSVTCPFKIASMIYRAVPSSQREVRYWPKPEWRLWSSNCDKQTFVHGDCQRPRHGASALA